VLGFQPVKSRDGGHVAANAAGPRSAEIMRVYAADDARCGRNDPYSCGPRRQWKHCHGPATQFRGSCGVAKSIQRKFGKQA
jgi:hypothetical protein